MREKLIAIIQAAVNGCSAYWAGLIADHLIENGVTVQRWIPVSERLPSKTGKYLVCRADGTMITNFYYVGQDDFVTRTFPVVTHWMPLPEAPKDGE